MKRIRIVGLSLVAVFALCAVAVSSASAAEVLFLLTSGSFPATFKSHNETGGKLVLETVGKNKVECKEEEDHGEIGSTAEGTKAAHLGIVTIEFKNCSSSGNKCTSSGAKEGEIVLSGSIFHLGLTNTTPNKPAILILLPGAKTNSPEGGKVQFLCGPSGLGTTITVTGDVIGELGATVGKAQKETKLIFNQKEGKQEFTEFLLSLTSPPSELMTNQFLESEGVGSIIKFAKQQSGQESPKIVLNEYKNSAGGATEIELSEG